MDVPEKNFVDVIVIVGRKSETFMLSLPLLSQAKCALFVDFILLMESV